MRIKGMARSFDLAQVHRLVERLSLRIEEIARQVFMQSCPTAVVFCCDHKKANNQQQYAWRQLPPAPR